MQGVGAVVGSSFLLSLIYFSNQTRTVCNSDATNSRGSDPNAVESVWRSFYFIGFIFVTMLLMYRSLVLEEGEGYSMVVERRARREAKLGKVVVEKRLREIFKFYAPRLVGTGGNWFAWDLTFYGLTLFSGPIFEDINPGGDLVVQNGYLLVNNLCALAGYYCAALVIDRPAIGRKRLQMFSFAVCAGLFMTTGAIFGSAPSSVIMFLYFLSSFFGSFGSNVTTYVMAAESYPTELRGTFHGLSAFCGKLGALLATIIFGYMSTIDIFWICGGCALVGLVFTYVFSADLTGVSLAEHDAQLE
jgi:Sugar (and other) transporter